MSLPISEVVSKKLDSLLSPCSKNLFISFESKSKILSAHRILKFSLLLKAFSSASRKESDFKHSGHIVTEIFFDTTIISDFITAVNVIGTKKIQKIMESYNMCFFSFDWLFLL